MKIKMNNKMYRQGDVLLIKVEKLPEGVFVKDNVLALGEKTGHYHEIVGNAQTYSETKGDVLNGVQWVVAEDNVLLEHKKNNILTGDHLTLEIEPGTYKVVVQREYVEPRRVSFRDWD